MRPVPIRLALGTACLFLGFSLGSCNNPDSGSEGGQGAGPVNGSKDAPPALINYSVIRTHPHDTTAYTEGLLVHEGALYESTGHTDEIDFTRSLFGIVDPVTGRINVKVELDKDKYFGEGIVFLNGKVYQLTYTTRIGFVYDARTFARLGEFQIPGKEGWGMTTDGRFLILSDGTHILYYLDPETLTLSRKLTVTQNLVAVEKLNELEYINGYIYANVYGTSEIVRIDPADGRVVGKLDMSSIDHEARSRHPDAEEMNGIAYDPATDKIFVTGKLWPYIYEVQFPH